MQQSFNKRNILIHNCHVGLRAWPNKYGSFREDFLKHVLNNPAFVLAANLLHLHTSRANLLESSGTGERKQLGNKMNQRTKNFSYGVIDCK